MHPLIAAVYVKNMKHCRIEYDTKSKKEEINKGVEVVCKIIQKMLKQKETNNQNIGQRW